MRSKRRLHNPATMTSEVIVRLLNDDDHENRSRHSEDNRKAEDKCTGYLMARIAQSSPIEFKTQPSGLPPRLWQADHWKQSQVRREQRQAYAKKSSSALCVYCKQNVPFYNGNPRLHKLHDETMPRPCARFSRQRLAISNQHALSSDALGIDVPLKHPAYAGGKVLYEVLKQFIDSWLSERSDGEEFFCDNRFQRWAVKNPKLDRLLRDAWRRLGRAKELSVFLAAAREGRLEEAPILAEDKDRLEKPAQAAAADLFWRLMGMREDAIGRCLRCDRYFSINPRHRDRRFCSAVCNRRHTAQRITTAKQIEARKLRLKQAVAGYRSWRKSRSKEDWQVWVSQKTGITKNFLTYNKDEITKGSAQ